MPSNPNLASLAIWLEQHQHEDEQTKTKVILLDSIQGNIYTFEAAFGMFVLNGEIDLSSNQIANSSLYVVAPVWGRVYMMEEIIGNLEHSVTDQFSRGPNLNGRFTLSLDKKTKEVIIDFDFNGKFFGNVTDKLALFALPTYTSEKPTAQFKMGVGGHKLFDSFSEGYFDEETGNFVITFYTPRAAGDVSSSSKEFTFKIAFLAGLELEGAIDPATLTLQAKLCGTVPLWGRPLISPISGNLKDGINSSINAFVARGTFGLRLSGKDLMTNVDLDVKFGKKIKGDIKLFTLPF